MKICKEN